MAAVGSLLVGCVGERVAASPAQLAELALRVDGALLMPAVRHHGIAGCVFVAVGRADVLAPDAARGLEQAYLAARARHLLMLEGLRWAADAFDGAGVPWATFKGPALSEVVYRRPDLRSYSDLDVVVSPAALDEAVRALEADGGRLLDANWRMLVETLPGELHVAMPAGGVLDLHWNVVCERDARRRVNLPTADLLARSRRTSVGGVHAPVLHPVDTLVHLAVHASLAGADRLVWLKDVEQCLIRWAPDWSEVVDLARLTGASVATGLVLGRARSVLGVPVPDSVLRDLIPSAGWRRVLAAADAVWPVPRLAARGSPARLVARASRDDVAATRREAAHRLADWVRGGGGSQPRSRERDLDPSYPGSLLHSSGGAAHREAYFASARLESAG